MSVLDVFSGDAFGFRSMTAALNKVPFQPTTLGQMNLFAQKGIRDVNFMVDERDGVLEILPIAARGQQDKTVSRGNRIARPFIVPHIPVNDAVYADDVQSVRAFGSETEVETVSGIVNERLEAIRQSIETTWEWQRVGAVKGIVLDADGTTEIYNYFDEFETTQDTVTFDFADTGTYADPIPAEIMKTKALEVSRLVEDALGGTTFNGITAICGDQFYDAFINHATVRDAYKRFPDDGFRSDLQFRTVFSFCGIDWINYRGSIGAQAFVETDKAHFFPTGVRDLFQHIMAPGDFVETVNTTGIPMYAKQQRMDFDKGIEIHAQSNPLMICNRPKCLVLGDDITA